MFIGILSGNLFTNVCIFISAIGSVYLLVTPKPKPADKNTADIPQLESEISDLEYVNRQLEMRIKSLEEKVDHMWIDYIDRY